MSGYNNLFTVYHLPYGNKDPNQGLIADISYLNPKRNLTEIVYQKWSPALTKT